LSDNTTGFTVRLSQSGKQFETLSNLSVLEAGLSAGISLPYGCANGSCGDCKARILSGRVGKVGFHDYPLTATEKLSNVCLLCSYAARSDLVVEVMEASSVDDIPFQESRGKICNLENHSGLWIVRFKLTRGNALRYLPGQYATVTFPNGQHRKLAIANCPCESSYLEFHIPKDSQLPVAELKPLDRVAISGPHGRFTLTDLSKQEKPLLFVAIGAGFSSIKPLIEHVLSLEEETDCALIWVADQPAGHYLHNLCRSWSDAFDYFDYMQLGSIAELEDQLPVKWSQNMANALVYLSAESQEYDYYKSVLTKAKVNKNLIVTDGSVSM